MNAVEYLIKLNDQASPVLNKIAESVGLITDQLKTLGTQLETIASTMSARIADIYDTTIANITFGVRNAISGVDETTEKTEGRFKRFVKSIRSRVDDAKKFISSLSKDGVSESTFGVSAISSMGKKILEITEQYNGFKKNLGDTFQSKNLGQGAVNAVTQFVAKSPSQFGDVMNSFTNLVQNGIKPTSKEMMSLGDLAASKGKKFEDVGSALLLAQKGDFNGLKELGVQASASGDKVRLSFKGVTTEVANNGQAIKTALAGYGNIEGVAGSMKKVVHSLDDITNFKFLLEFIPTISRAFEIMETMIQPVIDSVWNFLRSMLGLNEGGKGVSVFTNILSGALFVVDLVSTGVSALIGWLTPFATIIFAVAAAFMVLNIAMAMNPIQWIVLGIIALMAIIGLAIKYTDGWGTSWEALKTIFVLAWQQIRADFNYGIDNIVYGFTMVNLQARNVVEQIVGTFANLGNAIGMALDGNLAGALDTAFSDVRTDAEAQITRLRSDHQAQSDVYQRDRLQRGREVDAARGRIGLAIDRKGFSKDLAEITDRFSGAGQNVKAYDKFAGDNKAAKDKNENKAINAAGGITGGGTQTSHITINLAKMQDQIVINTINSGEGATKMRQLLEEELNRLLGSITLMQTT